MKNSYKININDFVVLSDEAETQYATQYPTQSPTQYPWLVRDGESKEEKIEKRIEKNFTHGCEVFIRHFNEIKSPDTKLTKEEEKNLKIMLENLVYVKKVLQDK